MDFSSMRPSSWNGVGAIAKVPSASLVSFVIFASVSSLRRSGMVRRTRPGTRDSGFDALHRPGMTCSKPPGAHLDFLLREENLGCVRDDVFRLPTVARRHPSVFFHHPHLAHAARAGNAEYLAGLIAGEI